MRKKLVLAGSLPALCGLVSPAVGQVSSQVAISITGYGSGGAMVGGNTSYFTGPSSGTNGEKDFNVTGVPYLEYPTDVFSGTASAEMDASGVAQPGLLKLQVTGSSSASSTIPSNNEEDYVSASMQLTTLSATFNDVATVNDPGVPKGTTIVMHGAFLPHGTMNFLDSPDQYPDVHVAEAAFVLSVSGVGITTQVLAQGSDSTAVSGPQVTTLPETIPDTETAQVGMPFAFSYSLQLTGSSGAGESGGSIDMEGDPAPVASNSIFYDADYYHTILWDGISSITDADGNPLEGWTVSSESGFDYSQPAQDVPEPAALFPTVAGGMGLLVLGWRKRPVAREI